MQRVRRWNVPKYVDFAGQLTAPWGEETYDDIGKTPRDVPLSPRRRIDAFAVAANGGQRVQLDSAHEALNITYKLRGEGSREITVPVDQRLATTIHEWAIGSRKDGPKFVPLEGRFDISVIKIETSRVERGTTPPVAYVLRLEGRVPFVDDRVAINVPIDADRFRELGGDGPKGLHSSRVGRVLGKSRDGDLVELNVDRFDDGSAFGRQVVSVQLPLGMEFGNPIIDATGFGEVESMDDSPLVTLPWFLGHLENVDVTMDDRFTPGALHTFGFAGTFERDERAFDAPS